MKKWLVAIFIFSGVRMLIGHIVSNCRGEVAKMRLNAFCAPDMGLQVDGYIGAAKLERQLNFFEKLIGAKLSTKAQNHVEHWKSWK